MDLFSNDELKNRVDTSAQNIPSGTPTQAEHKWASYVCNCST